MNNAHVKYIVGGLFVIGGVVAGVVAGMRKNAAEAAPAPSAPTPPKSAPKPAPKPTGFTPYADAADRDRRMNDATEAVQSGDQAAINAALARLSPDDRAKLQSMLPSI
jgi:hypothetical protein